MKIFILYSVKIWLFVLCGTTIIDKLEARRVPVHQVAEEQEEESIQYYAAAEPREDAQQRGGVVYVSADQYNGLYGQPTAAPRASQNNYVQPQARISQNQIKPVRAKETPKAPPVQTLRNYNKVNDDGSFTFGYEAADGSFKEETRGTDCVVRGKYGYVDPDGNKREFTYVSGNPCDPNAPKEEEDLPEEESNEPENVPANYPSKPVRPLRPLPAKPAVTFFQNDYQQDEEVQPEPEQVLRQQPVQSYTVRPQYITRPQYQHQQQQQQVSEGLAHSYQRPRLLSPTTPTSIIYKQSASPINITPRPLTVSTTQTELPATTYRPQLLQVAVTPRPSSLYTKQISVTPRPAFLPSTVSPVPLSITRGNLDFESEFQRFQHDNSVLSQSPSPVPKPTPKLPKVPSSTAAPNPSGQVYSSELVFDPSTGLYNTQLYQTLPQTEGDFTFNHNIQPYVHQPQQQQLIPQYQRPSNPLYRSLKPQPSTQTLYQQQQTDLQFQNSAQLYAQQQQQRQQKIKAQSLKLQSYQQPSNPAPQPQQQQQQQQYYYVQPASFQQPHGLVGGGVLEDFLRGQGLSYY